MKKVWKWGVTLAVLSLLVVGGGSALAYSFDYFYGGVTGVPGNGTTWGEFTPSKKRVAVEAKGKTKKVVYAGARVKANSTVQRAISGNTSRWWWV